METRLGPPNHPDDERLRKHLTYAVLAMVPLVIVGVLVAVSLGASFWIVGPLASLAGLPVLRVLSYYFPLR